jgi:phosphoribosylcarboxyaminoimidazole (NCAIR) mutase
MAADVPGLRVAEDLEAAVRAADVICTATMASAPVVLGAWLQPGQHLDLIGAYNPRMREVDDLAMQRASVFVDARATTIHHIGELIDPIASGTITEADVLIVVAGMEGALPSVVAGLADCPVIGVPTSVGYGASFGGVAPLLTMLNSCAVGVGVVNIDNGFGAAMLAGQILRTAQKLKKSEDEFD